jgi:hypothetical protein
MAEGGDVGGRDGGSKHFFQGGESQRTRGTDALKQVRARTAINIARCKSRGLGGLQRLRILL